MKKVFDNRQTCHVWAQQTQDEGRSSHGNIFFNGPVIYSYGHHFPLAVFIDSNRVLINSDSYSVSTGKHQGYVRQALRGDIQKQYADTATIKAYIWDNTFNQHAQDCAIGNTRRQYEALMKKAGQKKAERYKARDIVAARSVIIECKALFAFFNADIPQSLIEMERATESDDITRIIAANEQRLADERAAKEKALREKQERAKILVTKYIEAWYNHAVPEHCTSDSEAWAALNAIQSSEKIFMRLARSEDEIETSKGARFPIEHAKLAFKAIRGIKENLGYYTVKSDNPHKKTFRLGHYSIDTIDSNGNVKAGCHFVEWDQIERMATLLKIYP